MVLLPQLDANEVPPGPMRDTNVLRMSISVSTSSSSLIKNSQEEIKPINNRAQVCTSRVQHDLSINRHCSHLGTEQRAYLMFWSLLSSLGCDIAQSQNGCLSSKGAYIVI